MPKSQKKSKKPALAEPIIKPEPAYVRINENEAELASKSRILWLIVAVFSVILAVFWLVTLRFNIQKETENIGFSQIGRQISDSLARFDTEIKDRQAPKQISAEDVAAIRAGLEEQIKSNPDSSLWPTHELTALNISIQYPDGWGNVEINKIIYITDLNDTVALDKRSTSTTNSKNGFGEIIIRTVKKSNTANIISSSTDKYLDKTVYFNSTSTKTYLEIEMKAIGDISYYQPLMDEIVRTIKILK